MISEFENINPEIHESCFIAASANLIGKVKLYEDTSIWFGCVLRGDYDKINVSKGTNIQDNCTVHADEGHSVEIGEYVTIGHNCIIHGCKIGNHSLIGMGSIILDGAEIGDCTIIGAGSLITKNKKIPSGVLCMGSPAKVVRELTQEEKKSIKESAKHYIEYAKKYRESEKK